MVSFSVFLCAVKSFPTFPSSSHFPSTNLPLTAVLFLPPCRLIALLQVSEFTHTHSPSFSCLPPISDSQPLPLSYLLRPPPLSVLALLCLLILIGVTDELLTLS
eukprot:RCo008820